MGNLPKYLQIFVIIDDNMENIHINNKRGYTLIELLIVMVIGLLILEAAYLLYSGSMKLFRDVKSQSDNIQTKIPSVELIGRYFDRWGANVNTSGTDCSSYPPSHSKCITKSAQSSLPAGITCDEVTFWGNLYGMGFVSSVTPPSANVISCRLSTTTDQNCYYLWRDNVLQNDASGAAILKLISLSTNNADCSALASGTSSNATLSATMTPWDVAYSDKTMQAGDLIQRAPHMIRLYCAQNSSDANNNWLYVDLTDTAGDCNSGENASPIAPVDTFQVTLLGDSSPCVATTGGCSAARVTIMLRSQSKKGSRSYDYETKVAQDYDRQTVQRIFGR